MTESTITSAGQTTIPAIIREHLALETGDKLRYFIEGDRVLLVPAHRSVKRVKGRLPKPKKTVSLQQMNEAIRARARDRATSR